MVGAGTAGSSAAKVAVGIGASVTILDIQVEKLLPFAEGHFKSRTVFSTPETLARELCDADLVIGSVLIPGALAPRLITRPMLKTMKKGSVFVDICIDQGGMAETSRATCIAEPTYVEEGVVHYCVPNMPALVPRTSTLALTSATLGWISKLADQEIKGALGKSEPLRSSLITLSGRLTHSVVAQALKLPVAEDKEISKLIAE